MITQSSILSSQVKTRMLSISPSQLGKICPFLWRNVPMLPLNQGLVRAPSYGSFICLINFFPWCHEVHSSFFLVRHQPSITFLLGLSCHPFVHGTWCSWYISGTFVIWLLPSSSCFFQEFLSTTWMQVVLALTTLVLVALHELIQILLKKNQSIALNQIVLYEMAFHHDILLAWIINILHSHISKAFLGVKGPLIFFFLSQNSHAFFQEMPSTNLSNVDC